ncbi:MAG: UMP kinase [Bacilli bacterium]|nr:UMP kinase [Bacilli bacterium]
MGQVFLIKLSGEAMSGKYGTGLDFDYIEDLCLRIKECHDLGVGIGIVCGGGNFMRGRDASLMDRETADYTGMLATVMNSLVLKDTFTRIGCQVYNQTGLSVKTIDDIDPDKARKAIADGKIVIFGGGTGKPFFSTDTGASLRAIDIGANVIVKLTNVDGVYDKDPNKYDDAIRYQQVSYDEVLEKQLGIMDFEAIEMCRDNNISIVVTNINEKDCLLDVYNNGNKGTRVC